MSNPDGIFVARELSRQLRDRLPGRLRVWERRKCASPAQLLSRSGTAAPGCLVACIWGVWGTYRQAREWTNNGGQPQKLAARHFSVSSPIIAATTGFPCELLSDAQV